MPLIFLSARQKAGSKDNSRVNALVQNAATALLFTMEVVVMTLVSIATSMGTTAMALPSFNGDGLLLVVAACALKTVGGYVVSIKRGALGAR